MQKSIILILFICVVMASCTKDKWFDGKQSINQVVPTTVTDFQALLDNIIMDWNSPYLAEIGSDEHYVTDALFNSLNNNEKDAYTWSHDQPYQSVIDWGGGSDGTYARVYYANLVLDGLNTADGAGSFDFNNVKGQALFYRAKNFYDISQTYAPAYDTATAATDLSIPLRLESDINIPSVRSTVKQTYDQIISDLLQAKDLLPVTQIYKTRPSKPACFALLARLYLSVRDYTDAGRYADSCLTLYPTLVDYNTLVFTATYPLPIYNAQVIFNCSMNVGNGPISYNARIDTALYNLYDSTDLRKKVMFTVNTDGTVSFKNGNYYNTGFSGMTAEEMYIVRAECSARQGQAAAAIADINTLLRARYKTGTYTDKVASTADAALTIVLTERRKELLLRGLRWSDLRRFNKDPGTQVTLTRTVAGKTYTLEPNSYQYTFPIPDDVISLAPQLKQNPGW
jgi:tetratricopeptide (TPR) repeat protein